jgi:hypothetical protein
MVDPANQMIADIIPLSSTTGAGTPSQQNPAGGVPPIRER